MQPELSIQAQMNVHDCGRFRFRIWFARLQSPQIDQVLSKSFGADQMSSRQFFGFGFEPPLRRRYNHFLIRECAGVIASNTMDGVAFWHPDFECKKRVQ